ncbi:GNAT family N-acetyltransferase [Phytohalomonas tamaricis]|uniref:GNAT family N-acetyltransferase n=1 Tax=Phytohalomonas tamaricis TaxID=2081032 RepID=UPI000D0B1E62|nr:GNAT family N-acetyltransferase [Phytohalomonas tamaricis]
MAHSPTVTTCQSDSETLHWRTMTIDDLAAAHGLSRKLGWPHRLEDWKQMFTVGKGVALDNAKGELIGTGFCLNQGLIATLGLVIIRDDWQGRGLGRAIMTRLMAQAGERTLMLVATAAGAPLYYKLGFEPCNTIYQYQGVVAGGVPAIDLPPGLRAMKDTDRSAIMALFPDNPVHAETVRQATAGIIIEHEGALMGVALKRPFGRGEHIGPILAYSSDQAQVLIQALLINAEGHFVRLDLVDLDDDSWLVGAGLVCVDNVMRMRRGARLDEGPLTRFGLITQAMG